MKRLIIGATWYDEDETSYADQLRGLSHGRIEIPAPDRIASACQWIGHHLSKIFRNIKQAFGALRI